MCLLFVSLVIIIVVHKYVVGGRSIVVCSFCGDGRWLMVLLFQAIDFRER